MKGLVKVLTGILGVLAVVACLATVGVIIYTMTGAGGSSNNTQAVLEDSTPQPETVPEDMVTEGTVSVGDEITGVTPEVADPSHVHDYTESVDKKATCYQAGRLKYTCKCGDFYFVDVLSTGHVPDEWELVRSATRDEDGLRVKKCIYCDEVVAKEVILFEAEQSQEVHYHQYVPTIEREASCILAGLRKFNCSCGSFYTEKIAAPGHVATDWVTVEEPTTKYMGRRQRSCTVCGVILDSRPINALTPSPAPTASPTTSSGTSSTAAPTSSATPTATPASESALASPSATSTSHNHSYTSYVLKEANCTEKGIRSFVCTCGSSYAETIEPDTNRHSFRMITIPATNSTPGYTLYTCTRCEYSTQDNYTLSN